jgi:hypothetical protein
LVSLERASFLLVVLALLLGLYRIFTANINWDEFFFLSLVHRYLEGDLTQRLQTFHVHFFGWLPLISPNEIHQVIAARGVMWVTTLGSSWLIFGIARRYFSRVAAFLSVLFFLCFSYVMEHGQSFRADPICVVLFLAALYLLLDEKGHRYRFGLAAGLLALALMVSIKTALYLPTIGILLAALTLFGPDRREAFKRVLIFASTLCGTALLLYWAHDYSLTTDPSISAGAMISHAGDKTIILDQLFPRLPYIMRALAQNGLTWGFIFIGAWIAAGSLFRGPDRKRGLILLSLAVPLGSLIFYRNAFPYFFVFLMPAPVVLGGVFADVLAKKAKSSAPGPALFALAASVFLLAAILVSNLVQTLPDQMVAQRETVEVVHELFPEPVPYIDRNSMIASYPKAGFFMSSWGMEGYRQAGKRIMRDLLKSHQPRFVIVNAPALDISKPQTLEERDSPYRLFEEDFDVLRQNYVHHWGQIYVAGKSFEFNGQAADEKFEILVSGEYTLESPSAVLIDGTIVQPGGQIGLNQGAHRIASAGAISHATLRWGRNLHRPDRVASSQPIYYGF